VVQHPDETLANLGLPPNRKEGRLGFIVKDTDGKVRPARVGSTDGLALAGTHFGEEALTGSVRLTL
jgi:hypothetical protein